MIPPEILESAACPHCKGRVIPDRAHRWLRCEPCRLLYPVRDGFPILLAEEALPEPARGHRPRLGSVPPTP